MKRLVKAQQLQTVAPFSADSDDFNQYPSDVFTDYSNIAWVSPVEAQKIIDVFGNAHILEGAKTGTFYVNPLYLTPEVETLLWRSRGAKRFEGDDKGTYANSQNKTIQAAKFEAVCDDCLSVRDFPSEEAADKFLNETHKDCKHKHKHDIEKDGRSEKAHGKYIGSQISVKKKAPDLKEAKAAAPAIPAVKTCPLCEGSGQSSNHKDYEVDDEGNYYDRKACPKCHGEGKIANSKRLKKQAGIISLKTYMKEAERLLNAPVVNLTEISSKLKQMLDHTMNPSIKSAINKTTKYIDLDNNPSDQFVRNQMKTLSQMVFNDNSTKQRASLVRAQENNDPSQNPYNKMVSDPSKRGERTLNYWHHEMQTLSKGLEVVLDMGYGADEETLKEIEAAKVALDKAIFAMFLLKEKGNF